MWKIERETIEDILLACKNTFPNEFSALLGGDNKLKLINEIVIVPTIYGERHTIIRSDLIPYDSSLIGTVHSHPTEFNFPSSADLNAFSRLGKFHLIISNPYTINNIAAYDSNGKQVTFKIV